jgi:acetyltransferase-like isoleucine patch superfamily enzyme
MGRYVDIGAFTFLHAAYGKIVLEDYCAVGSHSVIYTRDDTADVEGDVVVESGAYIPGHTVILPGVTIGEDAIIGAHSLIKHDIPPREVWAGIPARFIKKVA